MASSYNNSITRTIACTNRTTVLGRVQQYLALARQRKQLAALDEHLLEDIGVSRRQALAESAKAPWDAPAAWHY